MTRRKALAVRKPGGRILHQRQSEGIAPGKIVRLRQAALAGKEDAVWGSSLGWLYLADKITEAQFGAGKRWANLVEDYSAACLAPRAPRSTRLEQGAGQTIDPDSAKGRREARRVVQIVQGYIAALNLLGRTGVRRAVMHVCELNCMPEGQNGLNELRAGLQTLVAFWAGEAKQK